MIAVPTINKWLWSRAAVYQHLSHAARPVTGWDDAPVYPINEKPESDAPYVIYTWVTKSDPTNWFISHDEITYFIWDYDIYRLMQLENALKNYLGREDTSAAAIRKWMLDNPGEASGLIDIKTCQFGGSSHPFTQTQESGVVGKGLTFRIQYLDCETQSDLV